VDLRRATSGNAEGTEFPTSVHRNANGFEAQNICLAGYKHHFGELDHRHCTGRRLLFGVLHSKAHELWSRATGTQLREVESGFRYTASSTFETFPFPWPPGKEPKDNLGVEAIAAAARELVKNRNAWLNPPDASAAELKKRTLTNLYNENPTWLQNAPPRTGRRRACGLWLAQGPKGPRHPREAASIEHRTGGRGLRG